jgi:hypothetical protein
MMAIRYMTFPHKQDIQKTLQQMEQAKQRLGDVFITDDPPATDKVPANENIASSDLDEETTTTVAHPATSTPSVKEKTAPTRTQLVFRFIRTLVLCWIGLILLVMVFQRKLIFVPGKGPARSAQESGYAPGDSQPFTLKTRDGLELQGIHVLPVGQPETDADLAQSSLAKGDKVILYFPGNAGTMARRYPIMKQLASLGCHVILVDYRGYAGNEGTPSEFHLIQDSYSLYEQVTGTMGVETRNIILYGESLGGGVATQIASRLCRQGTPPAALIVQSTFPSLTEIGGRHFYWLPVSWILWDTFNSKSAITHVTCPFLQIHGGNDKVVTPEEAHHLFDAAPDQSSTGYLKQFLFIPAAGHVNENDVGEVQWREAIQSLLNFSQEHHQ